MLADLQESDPKPFRKLLFNQHLSLVSRIESAKLGWPQSWARVEPHVAAPYDPTKSLLVPGHYDSYFGRIIGVARKFHYKNHFIV